jgi:ketosteroid isomerase-like protein
MKSTTKLIPLALLMVLSISAFIACTSQCDSHKPATPEELSQMNKDFAKALMAKDALAASLLYTEDASLLPPNEPIVTGRTNIQKYWQGAIDAGIIDASVSTIATGSNGDLGYEIGTFVLQFKGADSSIIIDKGKYTEILKRNDEGKWISIYGMWNADTTSVE